MNNGANHSNKHSSDEQQPESGHSPPQVNLGTSMPLAAEMESVQEVSAQEGYALWAASYDEENNPLIAVEELHIDKLLASLTFTKALDVGTGTGRYALKLARGGARVTAIDSSSEMLTVARRAAQSEGLSIDFRLAALEPGLPFESNQFDLLVCALTLCHVPDLAAAVQEFARVLRAGGYLLITDFHPASVSYGWRTQFKRAGVKYLLPNMPHIRNDYLAALSMSGLTLLEVMDIPHRELPPGYFTEEFMRIHGDKMLCLLLLAQKKT